MILKNNMDYKKLRLMVFFTAEKLTDSYVKITKNGCSVLCAFV